MSFPAGDIVECPLLSSLLSCYPMLPPRIIYCREDMMKGLSSCGVGANNVLHGKASKSEH